MRAARRLSPAVLVELLAQSGAEYTAFLASLDPWAPASFAVVWAGETEALNWFHLAREYTEKWHHQQQIREAVGQTEPLMTRELFQPLIETLMRGLPHAYRTVAAPLGTRVRVCIDTEIGSTWDWNAASTAGSCSHLARPHRWPKSRWLRRWLGNCLPKASARRWPRPRRASRAMRPWPRRPCAW
jgi:hypothetical protein